MSGEFSQGKKISVNRESLDAFLVFPTKYLVNIVLVHYYLSQETSFPRSRK